MKIYQAGQDLEQKVDQLTPDLWNKKNYVVHYRNLKQYLELGMRITKIHRALEFKQLPWLKPYIDFNTSKRAACVSDVQSVDVKGTKRKLLLTNDGDVYKLKKSKLCCEHKGCMCHYILFMDRVQGLSAGF